MSLQWKADRLHPFSPAPSRRRSRGRRAGWVLFLCLAGWIVPPLPPGVGAAQPVAGQPPQRPWVSVIREGAVWVLQAEGRFAPVPKTEGADRATFSPDGRLLAVHKSGGSLWLTTPDGKKGWLVAKDRVSPDLAWSPDGERLAYIRSGALWVVPCGPDGPSDWSLAAPEAERFAWSSDGDRLYVATPAWSVPSPPKPAPPAAPHPPGNPSPSKPGTEGGRTDSDPHRGYTPDRGHTPDQGRAPNQSHTPDRGHTADRGRPDPASPTVRPAPAPAGEAAWAAGKPVRRQAVRILEVKWRGGEPRVWGELPLRMVESDREFTAVRRRGPERTRVEGVRVYRWLARQKVESLPVQSRPGWSIWGVEGIYPTPGGEAVAVAVRDTPDPRRTQHRGMIAFTGRSAIPLKIWQAPKGAPLDIAGWARQGQRWWIGFLTESRGEPREGGKGRTEAAEGKFLAWELPRGTVTSVDRPVILTPEAAADRWAAPDPGSQGWLVVRAFAHPWIQERWRPSSVWALRPDGRAIQLSRPLYGAEDVAGWWGPGEEWVGLRKAWGHARIWWSSRPLGRTEVLVDGLSGQVTPEAVDVRFVHPGSAAGTRVGTGFSPVSPAGPPHEKAQP